MERLLVATWPNVASTAEISGEEFLEADDIITYNTNVDDCMSWLYRGSN